MLLGSVALVPSFCKSGRSLYWNNLSKCSRLTGVPWWISFLYHCIAFWQSASDHMVAPCQTLFRHTWNWLCFDVETFSAPYTRTCIAAQILLIFCLHNWRDSLANRWSTLPVTDFDIVCLWKMPFFWQNRMSALSSALRDISEWFCWLTGRENSHNACNALITISLEAV